MKYPADPNMKPSRQKARRDRNKRRPPKDRRYTPPGLRRPARPADEGDYDAEST